MVWAGASKDPGDEVLLKQAMMEGRIMVTLDKDFGELAVVRGVRHTGIIRLVNLSVLQHGPACVAAMARHGEELARGAIVTVEPGRVRFRPAD